MKLGVLLLSLPALAALLHAEALPTNTTAPETTGLGSDRLSRITRIMNDHVAANRMSGAIGLIARRGQIGYFETYGYQDRAGQKPMRKDTIFRIYSMSKAVTGVAVMMLNEEGRFFITEPVSKYLPEFKNMQVMTPAGPVTADRQITIRDLLRHTSGLDYTHMKLLYGGHTLENYVKELAKLPLFDHPGTNYRYGVSIDVLGRLVEVVSGQPFEDFVEQRIFKPLGMEDTGFHVPESKWSRLVVLDTKAEGGKVKPFTNERQGISDPQNSFKKKPPMPSGGGGLVSTAMDYARFCQMLLNGGQLEGKRLLSRKTVELMSTDHLGDLPVKPGAPARSNGFGLTFSVMKDPGIAGTVGSVGEYNWGGAAGTKFWIDPKEEMIGVFMINILPHDGLTFGNQFKQLAYQSLVD